MPEGAYEKARNYLYSLYDERRQSALNTNRWYSNLLSSDFIMEWSMLYDKEQPQDDDYIYSDYFMCYGSEDIAQEIMSALGDTASWESLPVKENSYLLEKDRFAMFIRYKDQFCQISSVGGNGTYITIGNYAIFYTPENVHKNIMDMIKQHYDEWYIIPLDE